MKIENINQKLLTSFNVIGFNIAWWICVLGVIWGVPYLGPLVMGLFLIFHIKNLALGINEIKFIVLAGFIGTIVDGIKYASGFISYSGGYPGVDFLAPLWITAMWMGFAALLNHSLLWLKKSPLFSFIMGAVFGPLSYLTGLKIGVLEFNLPRIQSIMILSAIWGFAVPSLYWISKKIGVGIMKIEQDKISEIVQINEGNL